MRFALDQEQNEWNITPQTGEFAGITVATAEGITLTDVTFSGTTIFGTIAATWGLAILEDSVTTSREMIRDLGIGQAFQSPAALSFDLDGDGAICLESNRRIYHKPHAMLMNQGKFYGN